MLKERPTQLLAAFRQEHGEHFQNSKFAVREPTNIKPRVSGKESHNTTTGLDAEPYLQDPDLTPRAEGTQMIWTQDGAPSTADTAFKSPVLPLCIYFRLYKQEGYRGDEDIFRAVYLRERTAEQFVRGVCEKSTIDSTRVRELVFPDTEGIVSRTNDEVLREMPNGLPLEIGFVPRSGGSPDTDSAVGNLTMRVFWL
ncbi:hypothetical protein PMG11_01907 [Penicillium brasilianum]|uniref:GRHL1/CP2 C-terminal domain-containing protein n=1 Tax=Penicillium brasilianum TaxID=104259 RepID=A0A0F7TFS8_PENBI|nr:hypothetical protein PMG11_01907 [Penicillium brasilianum]